MGNYFGIFTVYVFKCTFIYLLRLFNNVLDYTESVCINLRDIRVSGELLVSWKRMTLSKSPEGSKLAI